MRYVVVDTLHQERTEYWKNVPVYDENGIVVDRGAVPLYEADPPAWEVVEREVESFDEPLEAIQYVQGLPDNSSYGLVIRAVSP